MINRQLIAEEWSEKVTPAHNVPKELFEHQLDAMALLKEGKHVFLGMHLPLYRRISFSASLSML